jgi:hypothetical protein
MHENNSHSLDAFIPKIEDILVKYTLHPYNSFCKTEDVGMEPLLLCLERDPQKCTFSLLYKDRYFCKMSLSPVLIEKDIEDTNL